MNRNFLNRSARPGAWFLGVALFLGCGTVWAALSGGGGSLEFQATGPGGLAINGAGSGVSVEESGDAYVFTAPMDSLSTGIDMRDSHLKKAIDAGTHRTAKLVVSKAAVPVPEDGKVSEGFADGSFTFHGQTHPVKVPFKATRTGEKLVIQGRVEFDLPDYGVEVPCFAGVCVDKRIRAKTKIIAKI